MILERTLSRVLALTILTLILFAIFTLLIDPFVSKYTKDRSTVISSAKQIAAFERIVDQRGLIEQRRLQIQNNIGETISFFDGDSRAIVGAALQARVRRAIAASGGLQRSAQVLATTDVASHFQTGVRIVATIPSSKLIDLLNDLEVGQPTILLGDFSIRANARTSHQRAGLSTNNDPELTLNFVAYGFGEGSASEDG